MSNRKPKLKIKSQRRKPEAKLGYSETNRNISTLRKIEKANQEEYDMRNDYEPSDIGDKD